MRAVCLIVCMALMLQLTLSIYTKSSISACCKTTFNRLDSNNIQSYNRTEDKACKNKAYIVELKTGKSSCFNATSKHVISAIKKFDSIKKDSKKSNETARQ